MTKEELVKIYKDLNDIQRDLKIERGAIHRLNKEIYAVATDADWSEIQKRVDERNAREAKVDEMRAKRHELEQQLQTSGYTIIDARYYATGARPESFGGGLVPIKAAN